MILFIFGVIIGILILFIARFLGGDVDRLKECQPVAVNRTKPGRAVRQNQQATVRPNLTVNTRTTQQANQQANPRPISFEDTYELNEITPDVYITNEYTARDYDLLAKHGIKQILSVGMELKPHETENFVTKHISVDDIPMARICDHFDDAHEFIKKGRTLIHCHAGISRSVSIVIAHLIKSGMTFPQALVHVRSKRLVANPNSGFMKQLVAYSKKIHGK